MYFKSINLLLISILASLAVACSEDRATTAAESPHADLVLRDGYVYTVDEMRRVVQAVAIQGNRIVGLGSTEEIDALIGPATQVLELGGRMVMPGLHDAHIHAIGTVETDRCDLNSTATSLDDMVPFLSACLEREQLAEGEWLVVLQWSFSDGNESSEGYPTLRAALDAVSTKHPIILWGDDGHHGAANSLAMAQAQNKDGNIVGISRETIKTHFADFKELIAVDEKGEPSGGLTESIRLMVRPSFMPDMLGIGVAPAEIMPRVANKLASYGITSIQDAIVVPKSLQMYQWLEDQQLMTFRLRAALSHEFHNSYDEQGLAEIPAAIEEFRQLREQYRNSKYIRVEAVKLMADAVLEGNPYTSPPTLPVAAMLNGFRQPIFSIDAATEALDVVGYVDPDSPVCQAVRAQPRQYESADATAAFRAQQGYLPAQCNKSSGVLMHSEEFIREFIKQATVAGFHVHVHAVADSAVRVAVDAFAAVKALADKQGLTQSLAHMQVAHPDDQQRLGEMGIYVVFTYLWIYADVGYDMMVTPFIEQVAGVRDLYNPDTYYYQNYYPTKSVQDYGGVLVSGSDAPVGTREPIPFVSLQQAVTRAVGDVVLNASQRLDIHDALASITINGARLFGREEDLGSLEPGKIADLIVLDQNVIEIAENNGGVGIADTQVLLTVFDGKIVYDREALPLGARSAGVGPDFQSVNRVANIH